MHFYIILIIIKQSTQNIKTFYYKYYYINYIFYISCGYFSSLYTLYTQAALLRLTLFLLSGFFLGIFLHFPPPMPKLPRFGLLSSYFPASFWVFSSLSALYTQTPLLRHIQVCFPPNILCFSLPHNSALSLPELCHKLRHFLKITQLIVRPLRRKQPHILTPCKALIKKHYDPHIVHRSYDASCCLQNLVHPRIGVRIIVAVAILFVIIVL